VRHFFWDLGKGFDLPTVARTNWVVVGASVVLTLLTLLLV
jgi:succinate dehydrogenase / fumarate reductase cytochrome b subunit